MQSIILILGILVVPFFAQSQNCQLHGRILDEHGHALPGVSLGIIGSSKGINTNEFGQFTIQVPCSDSVRIQAQYLGFENIDTVLVQSNVSIELVLQSSAEDLHEVVVEEHYNPDHSSLSNEEVSAQSLRENDRGTLIKSLEVVPGVQAINVGVGIAKPVLRGMSMNRVVVTGNGVKQEGQQWGADHGLEMDPFDAEHVEVIKGPSTLKYGSGSAAGVINVLPFTIAAKDSIEGEFNSIYKSNNNHWGVSGMAKINKNDWFGRIRLSAQEFGDYGVPADSFVYNKYELPIYDQRLQNTAGKEYSGSAEIGVIRKWGISRITGSTYNIEAGIFPGAIGIPRSYELVPDGDLRNIDLPSQQVAHHKISNTTDLYSKNGKSQYKFIAAWQQNLRSEFAQPHAHGNSQAGELALKLDLQTLSFNASVNNKINGVLKQEAGIQLQHRNNQIAGFEFLIPNYQSFDAGAYYLLRYTQTDKIEWNGGIRLGVFNMTTEKAQLYGTADSNSSGSVIRADAIDKQYFNWSAALGMQYEVSKSSFLKLNFNRSYRNPSIAELASNGIHHGTFRHEKGNANLRQESGLHADISFDYKRDKLRGSVAGFSSYYEDFIYLSPTARFSNLPEGGQLFEYTQNDAFFFGGEVQAIVELFKQWELKVGGDYVWNKNLDTKLPLPFTPPGRLLSELRYRIQPKRIVEKIDLIFGYNYIFAQNRVDRNEPATPEYHLFRLGLVSHFKTKRGSEIQFYCTIQNLFNTAYLNHLSRYRYLNLPEQGRNVVLGLTVPFGI